MKAPDISVVMTFHRAGRLAHSSIQAAHAAISYAEHKGLRVEFMLVLDRADKETEDICKSHLCDGTRMFAVDYGSVALTRNFSAERAKVPFWRTLIPTISSARTGFTPPMCRQLRQQGHQCFTLK